VFLFLGEISFLNFGFGKFSGFGEFSVFVAVGYGVLGFGFFLFCACQVGLT
jgi:hypothetical protein